MVIYQSHTCHIKKGQSFISNRQRRREGTLRASGVGGDRTHAGPPQYRYMTSRWSYTRHTSSIQQQCCSTEMKLYKHATHYKWVKTLDKNGNKHPLVSNEAVARVFKRLADQLQAPGLNFRVLCLTRPLLQLLWNMTLTF